MVKARLSYPSASSYFSIRYYKQQRIARTRLIVIFHAQMSCKNVLFMIAEHKSLFKGLMKHFFKLENHRI